MTANDPKIDPEMDAAIERALDAAQLRPGGATASVVHLEPGDTAADDGGSGDGD